MTTRTMSAPSRDSFLTFYSYVTIASAIGLLCATGVIVWNILTIAMKMMG